MQVPSCSRLKVGHSYVRPSAHLFVWLVVPLDFETVMKGNFYLTQIVLELHNQADIIFEREGEFYINFIELIHTFSGQAY